MAQAMTNLTHALNGKLMKFRRSDYNLKNLCVINWLKYLVKTIYKVFANYVFINPGAPPGTPTGALTADLEKVTPLQEMVVYNFCCSGELYAQFYVFSKNRPLADSVIESRCVYIYICPLFM